MSVEFRRGQLAERSDLQKFAKRLFPSEAPVDRANHGSRVQLYIDDLPSVYTCIPRNLSRATFLWHDAGAFEVVIEVIPPGPLLATVDAIVRQVGAELKRLGHEAQIDVALRGADSFSVFIEGELTSPRRHFWTLMKEHVVSLVIALVLLGVATVWLKSYREEAISVVLGLSLLALWQGYGAIAESRDKRIHWTINERAE